MNTTQKINLSIKDIFRKCDQIRRKLRNWSPLLKKSLMKNFIFCEVEVWAEAWPGAPETSKIYHYFCLALFLFFFTVRRRALQLC